MRIFGRTRRRSLVAFVDFDIVEGVHDATSGWLQFRVDKNVPKESFGRFIILS